MITDFNENDVLLGRGRHVNSHTGNEQFRELVKKERPLYLSKQKKKDKRAIATAIVKEIRSMNPPGRFLEENSANSSWFDVGDDKAIKKTLHRLREKDPSGVECSLPAVYGDQQTKPDGNKLSKSSSELELPVVKIRGNSISVCSETADGSKISKNPCVMAADVIVFKQQNATNSDANDGSGCCPGKVDLPPLDELNPDLFSETNHLEPLVEEKPASSDNLNSKTRSSEDPRRGDTQTIFDSAVEQSLDSSNDTDSSLLTYFSEFFFSEPGGIDSFRGGHHDLSCSATGGDNNCGNCSDPSDPFKPQINLTDHALNPEPPRQNLLTKAKYQMNLSEWVKAAGKWIGSFHSSSSNNFVAVSHSYLEFLLKAVFIAHRITKGLMHLPPGKIIFPASLTSDSIYLDFSLDQDMEFAFLGHVESVSFMGIINESPDENHEKKMLGSLAAVFYEVFLLGKKPPAPHLNSDRDKITFSDSLSLNERLGVRKLRRKDDHGFPDLRLSGLPVSICRLVTDMMNSGSQGEFVSDNSFASLEEVLLDLHQMIIDPKRFLHDIEFEGNSNICQFQYSFRGRQAEVDKLLEAASRVNSVFLSGKSCSEMFWVSGRSGSGKTTLVQHVCKQLLRNQWDFLSCKFDLMKHAKPFSAISSAFDSYLGGLLAVVDSSGAARDMTNYLRNVVQIVENSIGRSGIITVCEMVPTFRQIYILYSTNKNLALVLNNRSSGNGVDTVMGTDVIKSRIHLIFCKFIRALSVSARRFVFLLDDLQWADASSLGLLSALTFEFNEDSDGDECGLLLIGCYRDDNMDSSHPLFTCINSFERNGVTNDNKISLGNLEKNDVNALVSEALRLPQRITRALSDILFVKTLGIPLLLLQLIDSMAAERLLNFSLTEKRWVWNEDAIISKPIDESVAKHFALKLCRLPWQVLTALKIASCIGSRIDARALEYLGDHTTGDLTQALDNAVREGFMSKIRESYKFAHDSIQEAAYDLIASEERNTFHLVLANRLMIKASNAGKLGDYSITFLAADQMIKVGSSSLTNVKEREPYIQLFLQAAHLAMDLFNFDSAVQYLEAGIVLLEERHWDSNYDLSLRLFNCAAYVCHILSHHEEMKEYLDEIFTHAKCQLDKFDACFVLVMSLGSAGDLNQAYQCGMDVLKQLGEGFPESVNRKVIADSIAKTASMVQGAESQSFELLPVMTDKSKLCEMQLLNFLVHLAMRIGSNLTPLIACKLVNLTLSHGIAKESARGIALFGFFLMNITRDVQEGYRIGKLAVSMLDNPISQDQLCNVFNVFYGMIANRIEPIQATLEPLLKSYNDGMLAGNIHMASLAATAHCQLRYTSGSELGLLDKDMIRYIHEMARHKQLNTMRVLLANHQGIMSLIGLPRDPLHLLLGGKYSGNKLFEFANTANDNVLVGHILYNNLRLASLLWDFDRVETIMDTLHRREAKLFGAALDDPTISFVEGVVVFRLALKTGDSKWCQLGEHYIKTLTRWTEISKWNWENKLRLIEAERYYFRREYPQASASYEASIKAAVRSKFIHQEGMAYDLWASMCKVQNDNNKYLSNMKEAHRCFVAWGAHTKAKQILEWLKA